MGEYFGLRTTIAIAGGGGLLLGLVLFGFSPLKQMVTLPEPENIPALIAEPGGPTGLAAD